MRIKRASKIEILRYIKSQGYIELWQMMDHYGYSYRSAHKTIERLKARGLIIDMLKGQWEVTYEGEKKLAYFDELGKNKQIAARKAKRIEIAKGTHNKP